MSTAQVSARDGLVRSVAALHHRQDAERAFERIYRRHAADVYRYALGLVRDAGDAEDVTQTTFLNAFRAYSRGERPRKAKSWLLAIAHNVCLQRFRLASRRPQEVALDEDVAEAAVPDDQPSVDDLVRALRHLSLNQRSALVMRELEGRSYAEIAEILGLQISAVETLIFRARRALREQLETEMTCDQAEEALSRQLDGVLPRSDRGALRAHLRACAECARVARSQRAQRSAWKGMAAIPLPAALGALFGGGTTAATTVAVKVAAVCAAGALVGGGTYTGVKLSQGPPSREHAARAAPEAQAPARDASPAVRAQRSTPAAHAAPSSPAGARSAKASPAAPGAPALGPDAGRIDDADSGAAPAAALGGAAPVETDGAEESHAAVAPATEDAVESLPSPGNDALEKARKEAEKKGGPGVPGDLEKDKGKDEKMTEAEMKAAEEKKKGAEKSKAEKEGKKVAPGADARVGIKPQKVVKSKAHAVATSHGDTKPKPKDKKAEAKAKEAKAKEEKAKEEKPKESEEKPEESDSRTPSSSSSTSGEQPEDSSPGGTAAGDGGS